jgi:hypothetical protein
MGRPAAKFFEAQIAPDLPMFSQDNLDWYKEMKARCFDGFSYKGDRFTGDQYFYYNFFPMLVAVLDKHRKPTSQFQTLFPYWSQEDDYLFKQIEEAQQQGLGVMLMTGRGYGKTYLILSIGAKIFYFVKESHGVISASGDDHANETWKKFRASVTAINNVHPSIALDLLADNSKEIIAGDEVFENGKWKTLNYSQMEKIVYDNKAGKSKGRRLNFQHWEEVGDFGGAASLKECIAASEGSWKVGSVKKCREFYTGTGGTILSDQAKEVFHHPEAYGIYKVKTYSEKGTAIFIPAYKKYGGYWEATGISDEVAAKAELERLRVLKQTDPDPTAYNKFIQEYPFTISEMFMKKNGNNFDQAILAKNITYLEEDPSRRKGKWCNLHWKKKNGEIIGVEIEEHTNGKIWILEEPVINEEYGIVEPRLYVGGYDGIDVGTQDTASGQGSRGALSIKKRMLRGAGTHNIYVCHYFDRPREVEEFFDNCYKIMYLFQAVTNIEDSKRGIVGYLKQRKALRFLMKRPRLTLQNIEVDENGSNLIGTTPTGKNFQYGETFTAQYIKEYGTQLLLLPVLEDLRDFNMEERKKHDITISIFMCEIGDDEFMDLPVGVQKPIHSLEEQYGYYTDRNGIKRWGKIVKPLAHQFGFKDEQYADYIKKGKMHYLNQQ